MKYFWLAKCLSLATVRMCVGVSLPVTIRVSICIFKYVRMSPQCMSNNMHGMLMSRNHLPAGWRNIHLGKPRGCHSTRHPALSNGPGRLSKLHVSLCTFIRTLLIIHAGWNRYRLIKLCIPACMCGVTLWHVAIRLYILTVFLSPENMLRFTYVWGSRPHHVFCRALPAHVRSPFPVTALRKKGVGESV